MDQELSTLLRERNYVAELLVVILGLAVLMSLVLFLVSRWRSEMRRRAARKRAKRSRSHASSSSSHMHRSRGSERSGMRSPTPHADLRSSAPAAASTPSVLAAAAAINALRYASNGSPDPPALEALTRAAAWLEQAAPVTTEERVAQALALASVTPQSDAARHLALGLVQMQRSDGGWARALGARSDAATTAQVLHALASVGQMPPTDPVYRKGVEFLLACQASDGSWAVTSNSERRIEHAVLRNKS